MAKSPRNTTAEAATEAGRMLTLLGGSDGVVESEAQGQREFERSEVLPTRGLDKETRDGLEKIGFVFGEVIEGDSLFREAKLPKGWEKKPTDHSLWTDLVDNKGRKRASIMYKAAFHDRDAGITFSCRYGFIDRCNDNWESEGFFDVIDKTTTNDEGDCDILFTVSYDIALKETDRIVYCEGKEKAKQEASAWLNENYPEWNSPGAYWD